MIMSAKMWFHNLNTPSQYSYMLFFLWLFHHSSMPTSVALLLHCSSELSYCHLHPRSTPLTMPLTYDTFTLTAWHEQPQKPVFVCMQGVCVCVCVCVFTFCSDNGDDNYQLMTWGPHSGLRLLDRATDHSVIINLVLTRPRI